MTYSPFKITGNSTGLVQSREEFILPDDAYPILENAFVWRERIKRKQGYELLGRLRRVFTLQALGNTNGGGNFSGNLIVIFSLEPTATIELGSVIVSDGTNTYTDNSLGVLVGVPGGTGTINYVTGAITITGGAAAAPLVISFNYFPGIPVMGLRTRETNSINSEEMIAFDQTYAYRYINGFEEFIPGTTWSGNNSDFFWSTNYWVSPPPSNRKLFWVTNFSGTAGDPIRYTDGLAWVDFSPQINVVGDLLTQCLCILPFRGRLVVFNTLEGPSLANSTAFPNRIRWAAIGNPISDISVIFPAGGDISVNAWRDDIRGKGGFLDIPTSEDIISVGFVRDNLVIYCERSTWQLRYTGRSISPFQIEKVNSELGAEGTFSTVQFDTSLVGIGDKGVVECDSYKSERIDIKIPDLVFLFQNTSNGPERVHGIRDFEQRLAYWTYPYESDNKFSNGYPNRRLVYNYENDSWAIFTDSLTTLGTFQAPTGLRWRDATFAWNATEFDWTATPALFPSIVGGNQQGYVEYLDKLQVNEVSLYIQNITGGVQTLITSPSHNLEEGMIIKIMDIPTGTPFDNLNNVVFLVQPIDVDNFYLYTYSSSSGQFDVIQSDPVATYIGGGQIAILDNFRIVSKKFNFLETGNNIQLGFIDILMNSTSEGAISLKIYLDYNSSQPVNTNPQNNNLSTSLPDEFFNATVPTILPNGSGIIGSKYWQRVFCPVRGAFLTIEWTLSNAQMNGIEQSSDVQIDAQILWIREAGRQLLAGF